MKHMGSFCSELNRYNKTHRLIGNVSCETLVSESLKAIRNSEKELCEFDLLVDVGAGSGVLGYSWLRARPDARVLLLEPDRKAVAFLHSHFASYPNATVVQGRLEDLSLDDLLKIEGDEKRVCLAARAFSSNLSLKDAYEKSGLSLPLFVFEKRETQFVLSRLDT